MLSGSIFFLLIGFGNFNFKVVLFFNNLNIYKKGKIVNSPKFTLKGALMSFCPLDMSDGQVLTEIVTKGPNGSILKLGGPNLIIGQTRGTKIIFSLIFNY